MIIHTLIHRYIKSQSRSHQWRECDAKWLNEQRRKKEEKKRSRLMTRITTHKSWFLCNKSLKCALTSLCKIRCLNRAMAASRFRRVTSSLNRYYSNRPTFVHSNQSDEIIRDCYSGDFITTKCLSKGYTHYTIDDIINFFFHFIVIYIITSSFIQVS